MNVWVRRRIGKSLKELMEDILEVQIDLWCNCKIICSHWGWAFLDIYWYANNVIQL